MRYSLRMEIIHLLMPGSYADAISRTKGQKFDETKIL